MRQNSGAQIVDLIIGIGSQFMRNCLIVDNHSTQEVIHSEQIFRLFPLDQCTLANNTIDDGFVVSRLGEALPQSMLGPSEIEVRPFYELEDFA
jgi:hypothetical protein